MPTAIVSIHQQQSASFQLESAAYKTNFLGAALHFKSTEVGQTFVCKRIFENENFIILIMRTHLPFAASFLLRVNSLKLELQTSVMKRKIWQKRKLGFYLKPPVYVSSEIKIYSETCILNFDCCFSFSHLKMSAQIDQRIFSNKCIDRPNGKLHDWGSFTQRTVDALVVYLLTVPKHAVPSVFSCQEKFQTRGVVI